MNGPQGKIPPELMAQLMQGLPPGMKLPPGMQMPQGMQGPAGMQGPQGMPMPQRQPAGPPTKEQHNPLPPGQASMKILKGFANCPIMQESSVLNKLVEQLLDLDDAEEFTELTELAGKAISVVLKSDRACAKHLHRRVAARFDENEELKKVNVDLTTAQDDVVRLQREAAEAVQTMQDLVRQRWELTVKNFGLNPADHFYTIKEEEGRIDQVELRCSDCKSVGAVADFRKTLAQKVLEVGKQRAEESKQNDGNREGNLTPESSEGNVTIIGKASPQEQEVPGVVDIPAPDDSDSSDSPD